MFGKTWNPATATVIDSRITGASAASEHGGSVTREFLVEVLPSSGTPYRVAVPDGNYSDFWAPKIGQRVMVEIEAKSGKVRFDCSDLGLSFREYERRTAARFDAAHNLD